MSSPHRRKLSLTLLGLLVIGLVAFLLIRTQLWDELVLNNKDHGLLCTELPSEQEVNQIMQESETQLTQIKKVNPGLVSVNINISQCQGRADVVIIYGSNSDRREIENIVEKSSLKQLPIRWRNM